MAKPIDLIKAELTSDEAASPTISLLTLWASGIGALFLLSITGIFTSLSTMRSLFVFAKFVVVFYLFALVITIVLVGAIFAFHMLLWNNSQKIKGLLGVLSDDEIVTQYNKDKVVNLTLTKIAAFAAIGAATGSVVVLATIAVLIPLLLF